MSAATDPTDRHLDGAILTPQGFVSGRLHLRNGRVAGLEGMPMTEDAARDSDTLILPGFVDLHVHGGAGRDFMEGGDACSAIAAFHARHGTTSLLATTVTSNADELRRCVSGIAHCQQAPRPGGARLLGMHLEGPYISPEKLGAQPGHTRPFDRCEIAELHQIVAVKLVTLAPEVAGHLEAIRWLTGQGIRVQMGHTGASYAQVVAAMDCGATGFAHLFNAMSGLHHRSPGAVGAALAHAEYAEIIPDLEHVHGGAILAARRSIPKLYGVTDATAATGMPDGTYRLGSHSVYKCLCSVRLADGTLAGSALTMDQALRNFVGLGLPLREAAQRLSTYAADFLGATDIGRLEVGARADAVLLSRQLDIKGVYVSGVAIDIH
jgi:N-acetylglucosamine-6-phosphate deacetylase